jgi:hypothetical protein|tara:strand:+ start:456 stop:587 length:132 start_codon:yes stop_codon:yes gene_type:complete
MKKILLIHLLLIFPTILFAQSKEITGTVVGENNILLPGHLMML